jgi:hypothetical protein
MWRMPPGTDQQCSNYGQNGPRMAGSCSLCPENMQKHRCDDFFATITQHLRHKGWPQEALRAMSSIPTRDCQLCTHPHHSTESRPDECTFDTMEIYHALQRTTYASACGRATEREYQEHIQRWSQPWEGFTDIYSCSRNCRVNYSMVGDDLDTGISDSSGSSTGYLDANRAPEFDQMSPKSQLACRKRPSHWICRSCDERFPTAKSLEQHAVAIGLDHHAFSCLHPACSYTSLRYKALGRHFDGTHAARKKHQCKFCDHPGFGRKDGLKVHIGKEHPQAWDDMLKAYPKPCPEPGCKDSAVRVSYSTESEFLQHLRKDHGKEKWHCPAEDCSRKGTKGYTRKCDLNSHVLEFHPSLFQEMDLEVI